MVDFPKEALDLAYGEITTETVRLLRSTDSLPSHHDACLDACPVMLVCPMHASSRGPEICLLREKA